MGKTVGLLSLLLDSQNCRVSLDFYLRCNMSNSMKMGAKMKGHGLYKYVCNGEVIYIGKSNYNIGKRIAHHRTEVRFKPYLSDDDLQIFTCNLPNKTETDLVEKALINQYKPILNISDNYPGFSTLIAVKEPAWTLYSKLSCNQKQQAYEALVEEIQAKDEEIQAKDEETRALTDELLSVQRSHLILEDKIMAAEEALRKQRTARKDRERKSKEIELKISELRTENERLKAELEAEKNKGWWDRLFRVFKLAI